MSAILGAVDAASLISWSNFGFARLEVETNWKDGGLCKRRIAVGMPKLPASLLDSTFYLYRSHKDAEDGTSCGGTGVFLSTPTGISGASFVYAVTNWHVAVRDGCSVMRFNKRGGGTEIFELDPMEWEFPPNGPDIAVASPKVSKLSLDLLTHQVFTISSDLFAKKSEMMPVIPFGMHRMPWKSGEPFHLEIGPGEDVFMVGRFIDHDGKDTNVPSVRFGNISTMPQAIRQPNGCVTHNSFILDLHSRTGYSGSPVFVYRTPGSDLTSPNIIGGPTGHFVRFLGLHWGQFPEEWEIKPGSAPIVEGAVVTGDEHYIKGMSGMTLAIPAWDILDFLQMPLFQKEREEALEALSRDRRLANMPVAESAASSLGEAGHENPYHREDFTSLLNAAAKTKPQAD